MKKAVTVAQSALL